MRRRQRSHAARQRRPTAARRRRHRVGFVSMSERLERVWRAGVIGALALYTGCGEVHDTPADAAEAVDAAPDAAPDARSTPTAVRFVDDPAETEQRGSTGGTDLPFRDGCP